MPVKTKRDEEKWQKAKEIAAEAGRTEDYAYIMGIYKRMKPDYEFKSGPAAKKGAESKYDHINFKPPQSVANAAKKGLEYRQKASPSQRGGLTPSEASKQGIGSGVQRAVNLKNRDTLSPKVVKQMAAFFSRHEKNKGVAPEHKGEPWNDKGHVAWLLWGGDAGRAWAEKIVGQMEKADKAKKSAFRLGKPGVGSKIKGLFKKGGTMNPQDALCDLLAVLKALNWNHWTTHWVIKGDSYYGDHLLFQRFYEGDDGFDPGAEIDGLGEKIVAYFGPEAIDPLRQLEKEAALIASWMSIECPYKRALAAENLLQQVLANIRQAMDEADNLPLGLDDYLASVANDHETLVYLLKQRIRGSSHERMAAQRVARKFLSWNSMSSLQRI